MGRPAINLIGQRFERLLVIERAENAADGHARWLCQCDCGNKTVVNSNVLKKGHTKSCGCLNKEKASQKAKNQYSNLTNQKFGKLTAIECLGSNDKGTMLWKCQCNCGNYHITTSHHLVSGNTQSCGCLHSKGEANIATILEANNIFFEKEKAFIDFKYDETSLGWPRYDFYLPKYNRLIEFDGIQHYEEAGNWEASITLSQRQQRDKIKNEYALSQNIPLVRIPYWERDNITLEMIMGDKYLVHEPDLPIS